MAKTAKRGSRNTAAQLEAALADQAAIESRKAELAQARQQALLENDKPALENIRGKIAALQLEGEDTKELITLLQAQQADEAAEQAVKARKDHENRVLAKLVQRRDGIVEVARLVGELGKAVRITEAVGTEIMSGWPWAWQDPAPLLIGGHLQSAISHEFYRVCGQAIPGWKAPSITDPRRDIIPSLESKADLAIEYGKRRVLETPNRALVPAAAPVTEAPPPKPVQADTAAAPMPAEQVAAPSNVPPGEHAFTVAFIHNATGDEHIETVLFGPAEFERCGHDPLGPLGPAGKSIAIELAQLRVPENYTLSGIRFDMQRMLETCGD